MKTSNNHENSHDNYWKWSYYQMWIKTLYNIYRFHKKSDETEIEKEMQL